MVTLKQIEAVYWVHVLSGFRQAADKLNTTQSAISKRIIDLESVLNLEVFEAKNRTQLTIAGRELIKDFEEMLALRQKITDKYQDPRSYSGYFRLGVTEMVALTWLPELIAAIKARYPKIILESNVALAKTLSRKINADLLDMVIGPCVEDTGSTLVSTYVSSINHDWMISKNCAVGDPPFDLKTVFSFPLLMHSEESTLYNELQKMLTDHRIQPKEKIYCGSMTALTELANNGLGLAYLPSDPFISFHQKFNNLMRVDIPLKLPALKYYAVHRHDSLCTDIVNMARPIFSGTGRSNA